MLQILRPYCDWISVAFKDKRKGAVWMCKECGAMGKGKNVPPCPCKPIAINAGG